MAQDDDDLIGKEIRTWQVHQLAQEGVNIPGDGDFYRVSANVTGEMSSTVIGGEGNEGDEDGEFDDDTFQFVTIQPSSAAARRRFEIVAAQHDFTIESDIGVNEVDVSEVKGAIESQLG